MRSFLARIFVSFWLIIGITIGAAALTGYYYAERMQQTAEDFVSRDLLLAASETLARDGKAGLRDWIRSGDRRDGIVLYVIDGKGLDLLGRPLPRRLARYLHQRDLRNERQAQGNLRPARPLPQIVAPDGDLLTFVAVPVRHVYRRWLDERGLSLFLLVALVASALVSYLLARTISGPVRNLREATVAVASGDLSTRVPASLHGRRDELGLLARDFNRMAERLEQAAARQSELSGNISHELRSPLARLRVALELARRRAGELAEFERIDAEAERLDQLIGQILDYSRLDAADAESPANVIVADLLQEVIDDVQFEQRTRGGDKPVISLEADDLPPLRGYPVALRSAIENVLRNAVSHSPPGGDIRVSARDDGQRCRIEITDAGDGVQADEVAKLFEPFFRTRQSQAEGGPAGNGLGLAIAARAVALHRGSISARNRAGGGLAVTIELPSAVR